MASIDDGVDYEQWNFKTAVEHEGTNDDDIDFLVKTMITVKKMKKNKRRQKCLHSQRRQNLHLL